MFHHVSYLVCQTVTRLLDCCWCFVCREAMFMTCIVSKGSCPFSLMQRLYQLEDNSDSMQL